MNLCRLEKQEDGSIDFYYQGKDGETKSLNCGLVLFGTGRKPIVQDMGLEVTFASQHICPYVAEHLPYCYIPRAFLYPFACQDQINCES